jgi:hypothetical protein
MPASVQNDVALLVNISTQSWPPRHRTYFGALTIKPRAEGQPFAITPVHSAKAAMDLGDKRQMEFPISAREIAEDIAREINSDSGEGSFHGVFVAAGNSPTDAELADARSKLDAFHLLQVEIADLEWERTHNPMFITDLQRRAARELHLEKPWLYDAKPHTECPACAERIKPGVAVCRACGAILDREKASHYGLGPTAEREEVDIRLENLRNKKSGK